LVGHGAELIINISASPYTIHKRALRLDMLRALASSHRRPLIYVNQVGGDDTLVFDGGSLALTADGTLAAQARSFEEDLVLFDTATGKGDIRHQPADEISAVLQALICGNSRLRAQMRISPGPGRSKRRHRFRRRGRNRGRRSREGKRHRRRHA